MRRTIVKALCFATALAIAAPVHAQAAKPLIIGHRGAAGERPEHTATGYRLAISQGADFIEPDLVMTKDGQFVDRHENEIGATTDVASHPEFAGRKTTKVVDGQSIEGWFTEDFTLAELRTLKARERLPQLRPGNTAYDGQDRVMTLAEVIALARSEGAKAGRTVGLYPELKHPTYFAYIGLPMEAKLVAALKAEGLATHDAPVFVQSFEPGALRKVRALARVRTVFLMSAQGAPADAAADPEHRAYAWFASPEGLREVARFADGIGPEKQMIVPLDPAGRSAAPTTLVADAHAAGLVVHPYTLRRENYFLPVELRSASGTAPADLVRAGDIRTELLTYFRLGVDGVFTDFPDEGVAARKAFLESLSKKR